MLGLQTSQEVIVFTLALAVVALAARYAQSFWTNYSFAKNSGLPFIVSPINPLSPLWLGLQATMLVPVKQLLRLVPGTVGRNAEYLFPGWQLHDKTKIHSRLGKNFFQVTPTRLLLHVGDPVSAHDVLTRWKDFQKLRELYAAMAIFGENLTTVEGSDWQRHRKLTAPSFNEKSSKYVWEESINQALGMLDLRLAGGSQKKLETDCRDIALHVLCYAGFNVRYKFGQGVSTIPTGHTMNLRDCLFTVVRNMVMIYLIPLRALLHPLAPKHWNVTGHSVLEFRKYMAEAIQNERQKIDESKKDDNKDDFKHQQEQKRDTFYGALIRASNDDHNDNDNNGRTGLSQDEVYGNVYIFNTAGHDTTANTILFSLAMLALEPQWQEWIYQEVESTGFASHMDDYETMYPRLLRCQALMLETTRLYGPVVYIPKVSAPGRPQSHSVDFLNGPTDTLLPLPDSTAVFLNVKHLAADPDTWGPDAASFRPTRWLDDDEKTGQVQLKPPPHRGAFLAWGDGARNCPGRKFSQVEFVAAIAALLSKARVEPALNPQLMARELEGCREDRSGTAMMEKEQQQLAREQLRRVMDDVSLKFTVALKRPDDLYIRWRRI